MNNKVHLYTLIIIHNLVTIYMLNAENHIKNNNISNPNTKNKNILGDIFIKPNVNSLNMNNESFFKYDFSYRYYEFNFYG